MNNQEYKPYVVSADLQGLLKKWARKNQVELPKNEYFQGMLKDLETTLQQYFTEVDIVPEELLREGMNRFVRESRTPIVSLDRAYVSANQRNVAGFLDATRTIDQNLNNTGLGSRESALSLERQIKLVAAQQSGKAISLIDDVIFEGQTMLQLAQNLQRKGVTVDTIYSGITIQEGKELLENNGLRVESLLTYNQVTDEVCERDFVAGAPYSGRTVVDGNKQVEGAPYFLPFGKPAEWASIPEANAEEFSRFCLSQSLRLWAKIEALSDMKVPTANVDKLVFGLPENASMSAALRQVLSEWR